MSKKRSRGISMAERLQATYDQPQSLPEATRLSLVPCRSRGAIIQPQAQPAHGQSQLPLKSARPTLVHSGHSRGATMQPAQPTRYILIDDQSQPLPVVVHPTLVPSGRSRGATIHVCMKSRRNKKSKTSKETTLVLTQLEDKLSQVADSEQIPKKREKIFKRFVGDEGHGRVRTYEFGPSPTYVFSPPAAPTGPSEEIMANLRQRIREEMREEIREMQAQVRQVLQVRLDEMYAQIMAEINARNITPSFPTTPPLNTGQVSDAESSCRPDVGTNEAHDHSFADL